MNNISKIAIIGGAIGITGFVSYNIWKFTQSNNVDRLDEAKEDKEDKQDPVIECEAYIMDDTDFGSNFKGNSNMIDWINDYFKKVK